MNPMLSMLLGQMFQALSGATKITPEPQPGRLYGTLADPITKHWISPTVALPASSRKGDPS